MPAPLRRASTTGMPGAFHASRANGPARRLIGRVLHLRFPLLQVGQFLLHEWAGIAGGQPGQVGEHPVRSLVLEETIPFRGQTARLVEKKLS